MPDPSFILLLLLQSAVIPFAVTGAVLTVPLLRRKQGSRQPGEAPFVLPAALVSGFLASYFAVLHAQWSLLPKEAIDWLPWILVVAVPGVVFAESLSLRNARWALRAVLGASAFTLTAAPASPGIGWWLVSMSVVSAVALAWAAWTLMADSKRYPAPLLPLAIISGAAGLVLMLDSSQLLGQLAGALAASLCAASAVTRLGPLNAIARPIAGVPLLLLGTLLVNAYLFAGLPQSAIALLAGGLVASAAISQLEARGIINARASAIIACGLCAVPSLVAIGLAVKAAQNTGAY
jgi:hypothetical protein